MRIGICGNGESGKDTVADFIRDKFGLRFSKGTSAWAADIVYREMKDLGHEYPSVKACWDDRRNHRKLWADTIGEYNYGDPIRMYRELLEEQDILQGIRWLHEFEACKAAGLVDAWLYLDRPGTKDPTNQIRPEHCDFVIVNDGTVMQMLFQAWCWAREGFPAKQAAVVE